ncbi:Interleukin-4 receptor subunit alpha [Fukomys damarensis]|uniref:Interleukin-4 receptor subunit alpha n=1 Tax=Fukomys damarensis TaxID=885580 RepID=A0A091DTD1_FUKDA|nr:Interleukin-4 receptor subunit alpha [Fukomys damarensis]
MIRLVTVPPTAPLPSQSENKQAVTSLDVEDPPILLCTAVLHFSVADTPQTYGMFCSRALASSPGCCVHSTWRQRLPMGWLRSGLPFPVSCLALVWVAGCGSLKVLQKPTCFSDYLSLSTCEWQLDQALECRATLHLFYQLLFNPDPYEESHVCVPENSAAAACVCHMGLENLVTSDTYQLDLWAGRQLLWRYNFTPSQHVKARAPVNLTLSTNVSSGWLLSWSNLYPPWNYLHNRLTYQVHVASESQPEHVKVYNVTYKETTLHLEARDLASGVTYTARVRALAQLDGSTWSAWSPGATWENYYGQPLEQRLKMGLVIACFVVALVCLSCYCSVTRIKREWWDQIPNPACSPAVAIVIQGPQVSAWEKRPRGQQPGKCPHWKTCLTKLLPCLLEHGVKKDEDLPKAARNRALNGPGKSAWSPVEVSKTVLLPETISVVRCVELFEAPRKAEEEDEEEEEEEDEEEGLLEEHKTALPFPPAPGSAHSSSQAPKGVGLLPAGSPSARVS